MKQFSFTLRILGIERLRSSSFGNPKYNIFGDVKAETWDDFVPRFVETATNSSAAYHLCSSSVGETYKCIGHIRNKDGKIILDFIK